MRKISEKKGKYSCYIGVDREMIINHVIKPGGKMMVIFATIEDLRNDYPYDISTNFIMVYEIPKDYDNYQELVNNFEKNWQVIENQLGIDSLSYNKK